MRLDKLTTQFQHALADAQSLAVARDNEAEAEQASQIAVIRAQKAREAQEKEIEAQRAVDIAAVQLLGGLGQRRFNRAEHHVAVHALLARDGVHQHQHFAIHRLFAFRQTSPRGITAAAGRARRPLKSTCGTSRASRTSSSSKSSACSVCSAATFALTLVSG